MTTDHHAAPAGSPVHELPAPTGADVLWTVGAGFGGMLLVGLVGLVPALLLGSVSYVALGLVAAALGGAAGLWAALVRRRGWGARELGFVRGARSGWHLLWEVPVLLLAGLACTATLGTLLGLTPRGGTGDPGADPVSASITASPWTLVVGVVCVVLLLPAIEEVVFRRVLLGWLLRRLHAVPAVLLVSALFGAVHVAPVAVLYLFFLGLSAGLLALWHRTLWAPLALHATNNALASAVAVATLTA